MECLPFAGNRGGRP